MTNRQKAYRDTPKLAMMADFVTNYDKKLKELHMQYIKDTGESIAYIAFCVYMYENAQDLIINEKLN